MPRWVAWCRAGFGMTAGRCLQRWVSPHSMPAKKHRLHWERAGTARHGPSKSKGTHPVSPRPRTHLLELTRTEGSCLAEEKPRGVPSHALCRACVPRDSSRLLQELPPGGKATEGHNIRPSAPGSRRHFSLREMSKRHPSPSPPAFWTQVFNEWRKTD